MELTQSSAQKTLLFWPVPTKAIIKITRPHRQNIENSQRLSSANKIAHAGETIIKTKRTTVHLSWMSTHMRLLDS